MSKSVKITKEMLDSIVPRRQAVGSIDFQEMARNNYDYTRITAIIALQRLLVKLDVDFDLPDTANIRDLDNARADIIELMKLTNWDK